MIKQAAKPIAAALTNVVEIWKWLAIRIPLRYALPPLVALGHWNPTAPHHQDPDGASFERGVFSGSSGPGFWAQ
jgi:hypothetical protein